VEGLEGFLYPLLEGDQIVDIVNESERFVTVKQLLSEPRSSFG
jgi:hypothetical protein